MTVKMQKKAHSSEFKFKVAIEAIRGDKTSAELCQEYGIVSSQLFKWKKVLLEQGKRMRKYLFCVFWNFVKVRLGRLFGGLMSVRERRFREEMAWDN